MLSKLKVHDDVVLTLKSKKVVNDHVQSIDRDGTIYFKKLGYRFKSGMKYVDHLDMEDIISFEVIGASNNAEDSVNAEDGPKQVEDIEELRKINEDLCKIANENQEKVNKYSAALAEAMAVLEHTIEQTEYEALASKIDNIINSEQKSVSLEDMTKKELLDFARSKKIEVSDSDTKTVIIEKIISGAKNDDNTISQTSDSSETKTAQGN